MNVISNPEVELVFNDYTVLIREKLLYLRQLVLETASEDEEILELQETLKWGEPSFLVKKGSTIRIDWKKTKPHQYAMFFKCTSKLVETFKTIYGDKFKFEGNRAIVFNLDDKIPIHELKHCISLALNYHKVKHLPMLGT